MFGGCRLRAAGVTVDDSGTSKLEQYLDVSSESIALEAALTNFGGGPIDIRVTTGLNELRDRLLSPVAQLVVALSSPCSP